MADELLPAQLEERRRQAVELRIAGATYAQIADQLTYASPSGAYQAVTEGLKVAMSDPKSEIRILELARLDQALLAIWPKVRRGDLTAVDRLLKIQERRARYLDLDAAPGHHAGPEPGEEEDEVGRARAAREARIAAATAQ